MGNSTAYAVGKFRHLWDPRRGQGAWQSVKVENGVPWNVDLRTHPLGESSCLDAQGWFGRPLSCAYVYAEISGGVGWRAFAQKAHTCCIAANVIGEYFALRYIVSVTHQFPGTEHRATPCRGLSRFTVEASATYSVTEFCVCLICVGYLVVPGVSGQGTSKFPS